MSATATARLLLPGDPLPIPSSSSSITLGPGTTQTARRYDAAATASASSSSIDPVPLMVSSKMGLLGMSADRKKKKRKVESGGDNEGSQDKKGEAVQLWVDGRSKRYIPAAGESVLGTIFQRAGEGYRLDIGAAQPASLDGYAFEGASKKNKPRLEVGTLVYARVSVASRDMDPEVECINPSTQKADGYGELKGGLLVETSLRLCRSLLRDPGPLGDLASMLPFAFEITLGMNGRIWLNAPSVGKTIALKRILEAVDAGEVSWDMNELSRWMTEERVLSE